MSDPALHLFGAPHLEQKGSPIAMDTRKALALIAYLAITQQSHSRDAVATLLWGEYDQSHARGTLRRTISVLNHALGEKYLETDREIIGLNPHARLCVDVHEFKAQLASCQTHGHSAAEVCTRCVTPLSEAVALYRDGFMVGFTLRDSPGFDEWQFFQGESLRRDLADTLDKLTQYHSIQSEFEPAITLARRWLALDPTHEPAHYRLMQLYARVGQVSAALRQYQECARVLEKELGVPPSEETTELYETIKANRRSTRQVQTVAVPRFVITESRYSSNLEVGVPSFVDDKAAVVAKRVTLKHPPMPSASWPFVGRRAELATLNRAYGSIRGDGHFAVLEGEEGVGKTRLAEAFLEMVAAQGGRVLSARGWERQAILPYGPFVESLRAAISLVDSDKALAGIPEHALSQVTRLLPELKIRRPGLPTAPPLDSPGAQSRFFEAIGTVLLALSTGPVPGVFFIDDLHWADAASLDLLAFLVQRLHGRPLFILAAWRSEQVPFDHPVRRLLADSLRAKVATRISLQRLGEEDVAAFVQTVTGAGADVGERLYRETEGLPLFVVEYLAALEQQGVVTSQDSWSLPASVRDLVLSRLRNVGDTARQLQSAAAAIGYSFDADTLREVSGLSEQETIGAIEELVSQGLLKERHSGFVGKPPVYEFSHEKIRQVVYEETGRARRRLLHRRVAESLLKGAGTAAQVETTIRPLAGQIAFHLQNAGESSQAAEYFRLAGEHARSLYANAQALAHFQSALALDHPQAVMLLEAIGDMQTLMGEYSAALSSYATAAKLRGHISPILEHKRGNVHHRRGEWDEAERHLSAALAALGGADATKERARLFADWSLTAYQRGEADRAVELARHALELAFQAQDVRALAQAHNILGILAKSQGDLTQARRHLEESAALSAQLDDSGVRAAVLNNLALVYGASGANERAVALAQEALALCAWLGDRQREAALHDNLADLYHAIGEAETSMSHLKQAVKILAEIGSHAGSWQPEVWKLVEW